MAAGRSPSACCCAAAACCCTTSRSGWDRRITARRRSRSWRCCCCCPVATFQGWGWLPLWWLALLFAYLDQPERWLVFVLAGLTLVVGPGASLLDERLRTARNPLYQAALAATESRARTPPRSRGSRPPAEQGSGGPRPRLPGGSGQEARGPLRGRRRALPAGARRRPRGRARAQQPRQRRVRARQLRLGTGALPVRHGLEGARGGGHLVLQPLARAPSKFEYQDYNAAKSNADRLAPGLVAEYDRWRYDTGDYAVVDLGLSREAVWGKFKGARAGVAVANLLHGSQAPRRRVVSGIAAEPLRGLARRLRGRRPADRALARAQGLHAALPPLRHALLQAVPPRTGDRRAVLAVLPPVRRARRSLGAGAQPQARRGAAGRRLSPARDPDAVAGLARGPASSTAGGRWPARSSPSPGTRSSA